MPLVLLASASTAVCDSVSIPFPIAIAIAELRVRLRFRLASAAAAVVAVAAVMAVLTVKALAAAAALLLRFNQLQRGFSLLALAFLGFESLLLFKLFAQSARGQLLLQQLSLLLERGESNLLLASLTR